MPKVNAPMWNGRKIAKEEDAHDLEQRSALYEFKHRMARADAEHRAHHEYTKDKHREAAAYHLQGLKAAQASGSQEEGHKHGLMYQLHMKKLGLNPMDAVPHEIQSLADKQEKFYKFKPHRGDVFLLQGDDEGEVKKSELAKGDVVHGNFPQADPQRAVPMKGPKASVAKLPGPADRLDGTHGADYTHFLKQHGVEGEGHTLTIERRKMQDGRHEYTAKLWNPNAEDHKDYGATGHYTVWPNTPEGPRHEYNGFGDAWDPQGGDGSFDHFEPAVMAALRHAAGYKGR